MAPKQTALVLSDYGVLSIHGIYKLIEPQPETTRISEKPNWEEDDKGHDGYDCWCAWPFQCENCDRVDDGGDQRSEPVVEIDRTQIEPRFAFIL